MSSRTKNIRGVVQPSRFSSILRKGQRSRATAALSRASMAALEQLEDRRLFSLLGISSIIGNPADYVFTDPPQSVTYDPSSHLDAAHPNTGKFSSISTAYLLYNPSNPNGVLFNQPFNLNGATLQVYFNKSDGSLAGGVAGDDVVVLGSVTVNGHTYDGTSPASPLLVGEVTQAGFAPDGSEFDFRVSPKTDGGGNQVGQLMALPDWAGKDIGVVVDDFSPLSGYTDPVTLSGGLPARFDSPFGFQPKALFGPIPTLQHRPTITTTPNATSVALGTNSVTLTDTADLEGGLNPQGTITWNLVGPDGNTVVDTEVTPVSGNGMYTTPAGYTLSTTAAVTGLYQWNATYHSTDSNNTDVSETNDSTEQVNVTPAQPAINTTPNVANVALGDSTVTLKDTATLSGGYFPSGTITFTLMGPGNTTLDTETVSVSGNANYTTPTGYTLPANAVVTGHYQWNASFVSDTSNNGNADDIGNTNETVKVSPASPAINTTPNLTSVSLGTTTVTLKDTAQLSGGYAPTGLITFTLVGPGNALLDTETVNVSGNGSYSTPTGFTLPTNVAVTGVYQWNATYNGDSNNSGASDLGAANEQVVVGPASPAINTTPNLTNVALGTTAVTLTDTAVLSGGYSPTGTITFTLVGPGNALLDTETVSASGNGSYSTPNGFTLPTAAAATGLYQWNATYSGDLNNNGAMDLGAANEQVHVAPATPTINTTPNTTSVMLGTTTVTLKDTAQLAGGYAPTGLITFTLVYNGSTTVDTETVAVGGNGSYTTPTGFTLPTAAAVSGLYQWNAAYSGDSNNGAASEIGSPNEQVTVTPAAPAINTTPNATSVTLGTSTVTLKDTANLSGGFFPGGTITFTLMGPGNTTLDTETVSVSGNGSYSTPTGFTLPTNAAVTGAYQWNATYNGDSNNSTATDSGNANERVTVSPASPAINTVAGAAVVIGSGAKLTDTATLSGGFSPTGTITFTLYNASHVTVYTDVVTVTGDATYTTATGNNPGGYLPTVVGTYLWSATYNGDGNNLTATDNGQNESETVTQTSPQFSTTPGQVTTPGGVVAGQFATIGFWHNQNGQAVINAFNGSSSATGLGNWMASNWPKLFGTANPYTGTSVAGLTNAQVAQVYANLWTPSGVQKNTYVQAFAVALGLYADTSTLGGQSLINNGMAATYGFVVTPGGAGTFNVGSNGAAFGVANGTSVSVTSILTTANNSFTPATGLFTAGNVSAFNNVLNGINTQGDIPGSGSNLGQGTGLKLVDSATITGGLNETGTITFYLMAPGATSSTPLSAAVYTDIVTVTGDGTYSVATQGNNKGGYVPTATGTYQWVAVYSGDTNNAAVTSPFGAEPWTIGQGQPTINTIDGGTVVLGSGTKLTDMADLEGASSPTGTITFKLYAPNGTTVVDTETVTVNGDGHYTTPNGYLPAVAGTYNWVATYSGDANNASVASALGDEPETVTPGSPQITTTPSGSSSGGGITIGGNKFLDLTGNGFSTDDTGQTGIKFNLYKESNSTPGLQTGTGGDTLVATATSGAGGAYSFTAPSAGTYYVNENVPSGYIQTGGGPNGSAGSTYYTINAAANTSYAGYNFDDMQQCTCTLTNVCYSIYHNGCWTNFSTLAGNTSPGDTVKVTFTVPAGSAEQITLVSYDAPNSTWSDSAAYQQLIYQQATGTFNGGTTNTLTVKIPSSCYQVDLVCCGAIDQFEPQYKNSAYGPDGANITYHAQGRYIDSDSGGATVGSLNTKSPTVPMPTSATSMTSALSDSATLSGGLSPGGTITFYLMPPGATSTTSLTSAIYTDVVTVSGDGTYTTAAGNHPGGYTPGPSGTYQWVAVYSGDANNTGVTSPFGSEPWTVGSTTPSITTTPGGGVAMGGSTISGTKFLDITGNGFSSDDTGQSGIGFSLYRESNGVPGLQTGTGGDAKVATTTTASDGTYSFSAPSAGTYYVDENVPSGYVQTGGGPNGNTGDAYYTVNVAANTSYAGYDFDDAQVCYCTLKNVCYSVYHNGCWTNFSTLAGNTSPGDTVKVTFTIPAGPAEQITLVSYDAPASSWDDSTAYKQLIYQQATGTFNGGTTNSLTVKIPNCDYQVDLVCCGAIDQFEPQYKNAGYGPDGANITYHAQGRYIDSDSGGSSVGTLNTKSPTVPTQSTSSSATGALTDSATLTGGSFPTGTVTFYLMPPGSTASTPLSQAVYVDAVTVSGNGTYTTDQGNNPGGYVPGATGTYQWIAVYSGDANNVPVTSPFGSEPQTVGQASGDISGVVFCDNNLNGKLDTGETVEQGAIVSLYSGSTLVATDVTDASGAYDFGDLAGGSYTIKITTPSSGHLLEQSHGAVTVASAYTVTVASGGTSGGNNFAEVENGSVSGVIFNDVNDSGSNDSGDTGVAGATVKLTGTDYLGNAVSLTLTTPSSGQFSFTNLLPSNSTGYTVQTTPPGGYVIGSDTPGTLNGGADGVDSCDTDGKVTNIVIPGCNNDVVNMQFGELQIMKGLTATIGFWHNKNGQAIINSFGNTSNGLSLANFLAISLPNLFGNKAPSFNVNSTTGTNLTGRSNSDVAAYFTSLFKVTGQKSYAQVLATAFAVFTTTNSLNTGATGRSLAGKYGFSLSNTGAGAATYTVPSSDWAAFGLTSANATQSVANLLLLANKYASAGKLNGGNTTLITETNDVFNNINNLGDIGAGMALMSSGSYTATSESGLGQLYAGTYLVQVDSLGGANTDAAESRIEDALSNFNTSLAQFGVVLAEMPTGLDATPDIHITFSDTSVIGGVNQGVLGVTQLGGNVTIVTGWDYYFGSDASAVGANQYDFETVVSHELGHGLGLGHSGDANSVMYPELSTGQARRTLTDADISVLDQDAGAAPEALHANLPAQKPAARRNTIALTNGNRTGAPASGNLTGAISGQWQSPFSSVLVSGDQTLLA